jgi:hypothetical protein
LSGHFDRPGHTVTVATANINIDIRPEVDLTLVTEGMAARSPLPLCSGLTQMDVRETIRLLKIEKERLERAIALLEELQVGGGAHPPNITPERRGRKSMPTEERREVSDRMKTYWASRRQRKPEEKA